MTKTAEILAAAVECGLYARNIYMCRALDDTAAGCFVCRQYREAMSGFTAKEVSDAQKEVRQYVGFLSGSTDMLLKAMCNFVGAPYPIVHIPTKLVPLYLDWDNRPRTANDVRRYLKKRGISNGYV